METLAIKETVDGKPIRYNVKVSKEVADNYAKVLKENPEMSPVEAMKKVQENTEESKGNCLTPDLEELLTEKRAEEILESLVKDMLGRMKGNKRRRFTKCGTPYMNR